MKSGYDFSGWASRYDVPCSDGRTIRKNAFKDMDGQEVTLTWGHEHGTPITVLGRALIEHRDEGPYIYGSFNNTEEGQHAKEAVRHGDVKYLSIFANHLKQQAGNVMHGIIREVSIVYGGANPGAYIDHAVLAHSDGTYEELSDEAIIRIGGEIDDCLEHADSDGKENEEVANDNKKEEPKKNYKEIFESMTDEQQDTVFYLLKQMLSQETSAVAHSDDSSDGEDSSEEADNIKHSDEEGEEQAMAYNAFENNADYHSVRAPKGATCISHADQGEILELAKNSTVGTFKNAMRAYINDNELCHDDAETNMTATGFDNTTALYPTMSNNPADAYYTAFTAILPEFKDVRAGKPPELVDYDDTWVGIVMNKVNKLPFSRVRTSQIDIREAEMRASFRGKGYQKGNKKVPSGNLKLARRTTDPQTVYVKNELHRDDIVDITDFDYVNYLYQIDRKMLKEELATAILFGDGRDDGDEDKIYPDHIRPIWTDDELYTRHIELDMETARAELQGTNTSGPSSTAPSRPPRSPRPCTPRSSGAIRRRGA